MKFGLLATCGLALLTAGCAVAPPKSERLMTDSALASGGPALLLVDVCLNESVLNGEDYFVVRNARAGAERLIAATRTYLVASGIEVVSEMAPFVCGALHDSANAPKRVAQVIDGPTVLAPQPFDVLASLSADTAFVKALQVLSTYVSLSTLRPVGGGTVSGVPSASVEVPAEIADAAQLVSSRTGAAGLVYVGVVGNSLSTGKAVAHGFTRFAAGFAASLAAGAAFTAAGSKYGAIFVPGGNSDIRQMVGGLVDLKTGKLGRTRVIHGGGDPMDPEVLAAPGVIQFLMRGVVFERTRTVSP